MTEVVQNFTYTGAVQTTRLSKGTYQLECWGAAGSAGGAGGSQCCGGYSTGILILESDTTLNIYVGGSGTSGTTTAVGGWNGGGRGYSSNGRTMASGGGGTDIRINSTSLYARVIVAGGGGGWHDTNYGSASGVGGGLSGGDGTGTANERNGRGGTQTDGGAARTATSWDSSYIGTLLKGSFGQGGGAVTTSMQYINGGGGGWYGGGAGGPDGGAGGGSGYVYTSSTASNYPSGSLLDSSYYLTNAVTIAGNESFLAPDGTTETGHSGDGYVRITSLKSPTLMYIKANGVWKLAKTLYVKV